MPRQSVQQVQQRVERTADLAALQRALSSSEQRLAAGSERWPEGARRRHVSRRPRPGNTKERVAYLPVVPPLREMAGATFTQGEGSAR